MQRFLRAGVLTLALIPLPTIDKTKANEAASAETGKTVEEPSENNDNPQPSRSDISREELCSVLAAAAQERGLPISFFSNLIWQESRFIAHAVSPAGAQGI